MDNDELQEAEETTNGEFDEAKKTNHKPRHLRSKTRRWLISPLWLAVCLEAFIIVGLVIWITLLEQDSQNYARQEYSLVQALKDGAEELNSQKKEFDDYKARQEKVCTPNMMALTFDQIMEINKDYVKNAMFMLTGKKDKKYLEYKIVLRNTSTSNIVPHVEIAFLDVGGNQMGVLTLAAKEGTTNAGPLEKGEVRSFDGAFEITNLAEPKFITLKIKSGK